MIDMEKNIFTEVASAVRTKYPSIFLTGEYVPAPPSFPCASIIEEGNTTVVKTQTSDGTENHARLLYEVNVYSNKQTGKKTEARSIMQVIDQKFLSMGFTRVMLNPIPNMEDATIYRMVARYQATVDTNNTIYRR